MIEIFFRKGMTRVLLLTAVLACVASFSHAQNNNTKTAPPPVVMDTSKLNLSVPVLMKDSTGNNAAEFFTLKQCIDYAVLHQPALNKANININITKTTNDIALAGWLPQVNASGNLIHNIQTAPNNTVVTNPDGTTSTTSSRGQTISNTFIPGVAVSQTIFNPSLIYAAKSAPLYVKQAQQVTDSTKIFLVSAVSKSYYNVLLTLEQINVLKEDTARLGKNLRDAYHQYKGGIVDETDYEEAAITLNNSKAQLKQANENVVPQYAALKQLMGYAPEKQFNLNFDTTEMMSGIHIDTIQQLAYEKRIEFQQLNTNKQLQAQLVKYYQSSFLPTVSAFYNYNLDFENNRFSQLFSSSYPTSLVGLSISIPIFTGFSRVNNVKKARLQQQLLDWDEVDLKSEIYKEYTTALAGYKSNYYNLQLLQKNVTMAKRVYFVVDLQYKQGIVPYLNVITAESNLITSEISYINALFQVLSSKIDLQKSMGSITY